MINKRFLTAVVAAVMAASMLAGCGSSTSGESSTESSTESATESTTESSTEAAAEKVYAEDAYLSGITASDYVTLADYSEIEVEMEDPREQITDEYVDSYVDYVLTNAQELVEITDRDTAEDGDVANIDYVGKKDGEAFDGGTGSGYDLTLGSGTFIDGFEDGVIGMKVGETKTLELTFPESYSNSDLAGQAVTFDVTLNSIKQYQTPELTDEWVTDQGIEDVTTVDEYKEHCRQLLLDNAQDTYDDNMQYGAVTYMVEQSTWLQEPPTSMVDRWYDGVMSNYETYASYYGVDVSELLTQIGYDADTYEDQLRDEATTTAKQYILMQAVADAEGLNLTDAEYDTQLADLASSYGYEDGASFEESAGEESIREYLTIMRAADFLQSKAVLKAPAEETTEASTEAAEADTEAAEASTEAAAE